MLTLLSCAVIHLCCDTGVRRSGKIKELEMEGARISWDELTCVGYPVSEETVDFVLRNIRFGATIDGLVRKEKYELPPEAIREMIINTLSYFFIGRQPVHEIICYSCICTITNVKK